ncbi:MAG: hypothetical protein LBR16_07205 [Treponema sp.]|jgi:glycosidase|nr:hypothetical protein [Treponema sp.]
MLKKCLLAGLGFFLVSCAQAGLTTYNKIFILGTNAATGGNQDVTAGAELENLGDGIFVWEGDLNASDLFRFHDDTVTGYLDGNWFNAETQYQSAQGTRQVVLASGTGNQWSAPAGGAYTITLDTQSLKVTFAFNGTVEEPPEETDPPDDTTPAASPQGLYRAYYEIFLGAFYDSNSDGIGDLDGLTQKLDYINDNNPNSNTSLHAGGIWLMPIMPSPTYHKYDVTNYKAVDSSYGTISDFDEFIAAAHERGIAVILDLVINHTSAGHSWFTQARNGNTDYQAYYNVSSTKVNSSYYALGSTGKYYQAVFWDQMPDLNLNNPTVRGEIEGIVDFWIAHGVDGFRLDAAMHFIGETLDSPDAAASAVLLRDWFMPYCRSKKSDIYVVGEVWSGESTMINFYDSTMSSDFNFKFAMGGDVYKAVTLSNTGQNFASTVKWWNDSIKARYAGAIDAPFLSNHDNVRIASTFGNTVDQLKMAAALYLLMPGNPFIYYGEELGEYGGSQNDESKRGRMVWSKTNTTGMCNTPSGGSPGEPAQGVAEQLNDSSSLLRFYIDTLKLKNRYPAVADGTITAITVDSAVSAWRMSSADEMDVAVLHNPSASTKTVSITGAKKLGGYLSVQGGAVTLSGTNVTLPARTSAIVELE